jgi:hypothetical protein
MRLPGLDQMSSDRYCTRSNRRLQYHTQPPLLRSLYMNQWRPLTLRINCLKYEPVYVELLYCTSISDEEARTRVLISRPC